MTHKELMALAHDRLCNINYNQLGKLTVLYKREFIGKCIHKIKNEPKNKRNVSYLTGVCRKNAESSDMLNTTKINTDKFGV